MLLLLLVTGSVIVISAICSLSEAVLYSITPSDIEQLQAEGKASGDRLASLRAQVDRPITAILTINTVANTAGAAVSGALAAQALGEGNVVLFSAALTIAILLFSEILPKTLGVVYSRALGPWLAAPLHWAVTALGPAIWLIGRVTRLISSGDAEGVSQDEILSIARLGFRSGAIDKDEAAVIQNILALSTTDSRSIMTPRTVVFALDAETLVSEAQDRPEVQVHSRIPVYLGERDDVIGLVYRRDLLSEERGDKSVVDLLRPVAFVGTTDPVNRVLDQLLEQRRHLVVVLDEFGGFAGVVTLEDVMEEILGKEIVDEFDEVADMRELAARRRQETLQRMRDDGGKR
jgi:CBS domain containing-hemolysin-like protein